MVHRVQATYPGISHPNRQSLLTLVQLHHQKMWPFLSVILSDALRGTPADGNDPVDLADRRRHRAAESQRVDSKCDLGWHSGNVCAGEVEVELTRWIPQHGSIEVPDLNPDSDFANCQQDAEPKKHQQRPGHYIQEAAAVASQQQRSQSQAYPSHADKPHHSRHGVGWHTFVYRTKR